MMLEAITNFRSRVAMHLFSGGEVRFSVTRGLDERKTDKAN
jgi:hypothetical protein